MDASLSAAMMTRLQQDFSGGQRDGTRIATSHVIDAAGAGGRDVARMAGLDIPVVNVKQMIFAFESPFSCRGMPYVFTPDRLFFRPEGNAYIAGLGISDHEEMTDSEVDHGLFEHAPGIGRALSELIVYG